VFKSACLHPSIQIAMMTLSLAVAAPTLSEADEITVFAAASLANAMTEIKDRFEATSEHDLIVSLAGSSALARQIQQGAPADIFISANSDWMDMLEADGLIEEGTRFDLLNNALVLIAARTEATEATAEATAEAAAVEIGPNFDLVGLLGEGRLAMALVDAVPAGIYGKAALESLGLWKDVEPQVAQADNVRAALAFVAAGEAPYGIVYATDAVASGTATGTVSGTATGTVSGTVSGTVTGRATGNVTVVGIFPADTHPPIVYPVADLANRDVPAETEFLDYLRGPEARAAFERQGFVVLPQ
jgi:molybdate transport system substrate-binding protein